MMDRAGATPAPTSEPASANSREASDKASGEHLSPDALPLWLPGERFVREPNSWDGRVAVRGYRYGTRDVEVPPLRDHAVVAYRLGVTTMSRRVERRWSKNLLGPGAVSLLTRGVPSHWTWPDEIEVVHVYLPSTALESVSAEMFGRETAGIELHDALDVDDEDIHRTVMSFAREATRPEAGDTLLISSLVCQLSVQVLRRHARVRFTGEPSTTRLSARDLARVREFARANLGEPITLGDLARQVALSKYHFARRFREATALSPYEYVLQLRVERAAQLIRSTDLGLAEVARLCGFSDQSHLTRHFRQRIGTTPGRYRSDTTT